MVSFFRGSKKSNDLPKVTGLEQWGQGSNPCLKGSEDHTEPPTSCSLLLVFFPALQKRQLKLREANLLMFTRLVRGRSYI